MSSKHNGTFLLLAVTAMIALVLVGCSSGKGGADPVAGTTAATKSAMQPGSAAKTTGGVVDVSTQKCFSCSQGKMAPAVSGTVQENHGVQDINVSITNGVYSPNRFTAKAGTPIDLVFTVVGKPATGCLSNPTLKSLNKTVHITTGSKTLSLGTLSPGTYEFTCAMGMNVGKIVVQ